MAVSFPTANFISIYIYSYGGYFAIWGTSLALGALTLLYIVFFIQDSRGIEREDQIDTSSSTNFGQENEDFPDVAVVQCSLSSVAINLWECFAVTFQARNGYKRACLSILLASMCFFVFQSMYNLIV